MISNHRCSKHIKPLEESRIFVTQPLSIGEVLSRSEWFPSLPIADFTSF
jgi:hypothetical protein